LRNIKQDLKSGILLKTHLLRKGNNVQEVVEEYILFLFLFLFLEQEVKQPIAEPTDYTGEATQSCSEM
jgi:hypothetical protein